MKTASKNSKGHESSTQGRSFFKKPVEQSFFQNVQPKLTVGQPGDKYEVEADAMADRVVQKLQRKENGETPFFSNTHGNRQIQTKCSECAGEEVQPKEDELVEEPIQMKLQSQDILQAKCEACEAEEVQRKEQDLDEEPIQTKLQSQCAIRAKGEGVAADAGLERQLNISKGGGRGMSDSTRSAMETSFGTDFSSVRIHTGSNAIQMNQNLNAQAFTHGDDVFFNQGKYKPETTTGQHLLAHELTHVVQQKGAVLQKAGNSPSIQKLGNVAQVPAGMSCTIATSSPNGISEITFGTNSSHIPPAQITMINGFVRGWHAGGGNSNIRLDGYASSEGPDPLNWQLSCSRANTVRAELESPSDGSLGISAGFIEVFAQGETNEFGTNLSANRKVIISTLARPVPPPTFRTEVTDFGTYDVYPDSFVGPLLPNQLREADFQRLRTAWNTMVSNSGGMITNGTNADRQSLRNIFGREIQRSMTFRNLFLEIVEDATHPVIINVGRNNASWVDSFATNNVDLNDIGTFEESPRPGFEWVQTQGEIVIHWLSERRFAAVNGRANFGPAHAHALQPGGVQENFRQDIGQTGRIVSQVRINGAGGLHQGVYTDDSGNVMRIRRDDSGGNPVPYEIVYEPTGAAAAAHHTRTNFMNAQVNSNAAAAENLYIRFSVPGRTVNTAPLAVGAASNQQFSAALGRLVPTGATIRVRIFRRSGIGIDTQIASLNWSHPFDTSNVQANSGGTIYNLSVSLNMSN